MLGGLPGKNVQYYLVLRGLSQEDLATRMRTTKASISRLIYNKQNITLDMLRRVAAALEVEISELFRPLPVGEDLAREGYQPTRFPALQAELIALTNQLPPQSVRHVLCLVRSLVAAQASLIPHAAPPPR